MIDFIEEMDQDFIDYCYQTNVERAFPAIDGLKPGQRACLYEMFRKGYLPSKPPVKSAKVSGGVIAELWPHGDNAIYDTFARQSQAFVNNLPLCEFHGSNGNQIIPEPASSRYTEVRLSKAGLEMFEGIKKKNVPFIMNFDETVEWPEILPSPLPMLLINGSEGIGTTIAQKFLPYDSNEVSLAYKNYIITGEMDYNLSPSFPTGGKIINKDDLSIILKTGKGKVVLRARAEIKTEKKKNIIEFNEICYQTCVRDLMEEFKAAYDKDELSGVEDIINLSGKKGVCIQFICEDTANPAQVLSMLYQKTNLQKTYNANQNLLVGKIPQLVTTENYFKLLYKHNDECLIRECNYDRDKALIRKEECEGLLIAIANIDDIIAIVRGSKDKTEASSKLIAKYKFTDRQASCILKMTIGQLTKLDGIKIEDELKELVSLIDELTELLNSSDKRKEVIVNNIDNLIKKYPSVRKTELVQIEIPKNKSEKETTEVIPEDCVVLTTANGSVKRVPLSNYKVQKRNTKGTKNDEMILDATKTNTVDTMLFFTDAGTMYRCLVDKIPNGTNTSKGCYIGELVKFDGNEKIVAVSSLHRTSVPKYAVFFTKKGLVKKTLLEEYMKSSRAGGMQAIKLNEGDSIIKIIFMDDEELIIVSKLGMGIRFSSSDIGAAGRVTKGVKAIALMDNDEVISALPIHKDTDKLALFAESGIAKKMPINELPKQARGGKGVIVYKDEVVVGAAMVSDDDNILINGYTNSIVISAADIPSLNRLSAGNIMIKGNKVKSISKI